LHVNEIRDAVKRLALEAEVSLDERTLHVIEDAQVRESSELGAKILGEILENTRIAAREKRPLCQDTGLAIVWIEIGSSVALSGGTVHDAVDEGIRDAWREGGFRNSVVADPFERTNTGDNTPALVHVEEVSGHGVVVHFLAKGGGSENQSCLTVLKPSQGRAGVVEWIVSSVSQRAAYACPPVVVGVGIGGSIDHAAWLSKKALFRPLGEPSTHEATASLERELLEGVNASGVGPMGLGGTVTAFAVHVERAPCHIASLPVAISLNCHSHRTRTIEI
jgi:fumarate hydratase subunit alpha